MGLIELIILSVGLAMDAFAVAICKGLSMSKMNWKKGLIIGAYFGIFQALMPLIGYVLGVNFQENIQSVDHWIAFILLGIIGINMLKEAVTQEKENSNDSVKFKDMLILAVATSIDALAVGITFAFLKTNYVAISFVLIGVITFILSMLGVKIGNVFGSKYEKKAEFAGGLILVLLGIKILLEHLGILAI